MKNGLVVRTIICIGINSILLSNKKLFLEFDQSQHLRFPGVITVEEEPGHLSIVSAHLVFDWKAYGSIPEYNTKVVKTRSQGFIPIRDNNHYHGYE